jgi:hypothetical protein
MIISVGRRTTFFAVGILLVAGCDSEFVPVKGQVRFQGTPLAAGTVTFYPITGGAPGYASVVDGNYTAKTGTKSGLRQGEYWVTVAAHEATPAASTTFTEAAPRLITPLRYSRQETSGLRCTVPSQGTQFDIPLKSQ